MDFARLPGSDQIKLSTTPKAITHKPVAQLMPFSHVSSNAIPLADTLCGFFDQALLAFLEERCLPYIIAVRMTTQVRVRLGSSAVCWREIASGYVVGGFTAKEGGRKPSTL